MRKESKYNFKMPPCSQISEQMVAQLVLKENLLDLRNFLMIKSALIPESYRRRVRNVETNYINYNLATLGMAVGGNVIVSRYLPGWKSLTFMFRFATVLGVICLSVSLMNPLMKQNREEKTVIYSGIMQRVNQLGETGDVPNYLK